MVRFEQRLVGWKRIFLSEGERLMLVNSTMTNSHYIICPS